MFDQDFFTFCTGLKLLELKAIGELSRDAEESNKDQIYLSNLSKLLCKADPRLLLSDRRC